MIRPKVMTPDDYLVIRPTTKTYLHRRDRPEFQLEAKHKAGQFQLFLILSNRPVAESDLSLWKRSGVADSGGLVQLAIKTFDEVYSGSYHLPAQVWATFKNEQRVYYCAASYDVSVPTSPNLRYCTAYDETTPFLHTDHPENNCLYKPTPAADRRFQLSIDGNRLVTNVNGKKTSIRLRGVNISGLQSRPWFSGVPSPGPGESTPLTDPTQVEWHTVAGIERSQLEDIRNWGANVIRLTISQEWALKDLAHPTQTGKRSTPALYLRAVDNVVAWATALELYVIICLHNQGLKKPAFLIDGFEKYLADKPACPPPSDKVLRAYFERQPYVSHMPDNNSLLFWAMICSRYSRNPLVLYDLLNEPHRIEPTRHREDEARPLVQIAKLPPVDNKGYFDDDPFRHYYEGPTPTVDKQYDVPNEWSQRWHAWVRAMHPIVQAASPKALMLVSGFDGPVWSMSLRTMPVREAKDEGLARAIEAKGPPLPNIIYSSHIYWQDWGYGTEDNHSKTPEIWRFWLKMDKTQEVLTTKYPVFVAEWGVHTKQSLGIYRSLHANANPATVADFDEYAEACRNQIIYEFWWQVARHIDRWEKSGATGDLPKRIVCDQKMLTWGQDLVDFLDGVTKANGVRTRGEPPPGLVGWAAWSYQDQPHMVAQFDPRRGGAFYARPSKNRNADTKDANGNPVKMPRELLTDFGELVFNQLRVPPPPRP